MWVILACKKASVFLNVKNIGIHIKEEILELLGYFSVEFVQWGKRFIFLKTEFDVEYFSLVVEFDAVSVLVDASHREK